MKHVLLFAAILFFLGSQSYPQYYPVADWFPVHQGDKWIYEHETRDIGVNGNLPPFEIHQWKTEETTVGTWAVPEGTVVERHLQVVEGSPRQGWRVNTDPIYLIRGSCLYGPEYGEASWDSATHRLAEDFIKGLSTYSSPDFCFPLIVNKTWGAPHGLPDWDVSLPEDAKDWQVTGTEPHDPFAPDQQSTFHVTSISSYPGGGETVEIWFEKGVGLVREEEIHQGTIGEIRTHLLAFQPASRN